MLTFEKQVKTSPLKLPYIIVYKLLFNSSIIYYNLSPPISSSYLN